MRNKQHTLLAGVAALALLTATGTAIAQQSQQNPQVQNGAQTTNRQGSMQAQPAKSGAAIQQHAQTAAPSGKAAAANTQGPKTNQLPATAQRHVAKPNRSAQISPSQSNRHGAKRTAQSRQQHMSATTPSRRNQSTAQTERGRNGRMNTAQRTEKNGNLKGLQGNASLPMRGANGNISLTPEQRTRVRNTVIDARGAPRIGHVGFNVRVGILVPRRHVHIVPVPETLVQINPQWRGFLYFIVRDEVVIVNPRDMRIVAVLPA